MFRRKKKRWRLFKLVLFVLIFVAIGIGGVYGAAYLMGPPPIEKQYKTTLYSADEEVIGEEPRGKSHTYVSLDEIAEPAILASLVVEDKNFYHHHGFDVKRIGGAILKDIQTMSLKEGASTLTQQYARNLYLDFDKTLTRKAKEAFYTIRLEMFYSKDDILEGYLNRIYYGHGMYGIEAASTYYFDKSAKDLTIAEAAMLAGIPKGPTYYSPINHPDNAKDRQEHILALLNKYGEITDEEYETAQEEDLQYAEAVTKDETTEVGPYFQDMALREAANLLDIELEEVRTGGYEIQTTLDIDLQENLNKQVDDTLADDSDMQVGAISLNPLTGDIVAMVGGSDYKESTFNRATRANRMPGSAFKPFLYYKALEHGFTPTTMLMSEETTFDLDNDKTYKPHNFNHNYADKPITLAQALALSDNIYAVKTNLFLKPEKLVDISNQLGIDRDLPAVPSLALGSATVSVEEMTKAYGILANGGREVDQHTVQKIKNRDGDVLYENERSSGEQILDPEKTSVLTQLMTGMFDSSLDGYMSVTGASIAPTLTQPYAGKSGSTEGDSWMIGYSPALVTSVWTGYDDNRDIEDPTEMGYAKNIWANYMEAAHAGEEDLEFQIPAGVVAVDIDPETGKRATPYCETTRKMYFEKGTVPTETCTDHLHGTEQKDWSDYEDTYPDPPKQDDKNGKKKNIFDDWKDLFQQGMEQMPTPDNDSA